MDIEVFSKIAAIAFGAVTAWNLIIALLKGRKSQFREDYKFAKEFIQDLDGAASRSLFLKQRGSLALTGNALFEINTLLHLLDFENPSQSIHDYSLGFRYLEYRQVVWSQGHVQFRGAYTNRWRRSLLKAWFLFLYFATYALAFSPMLLNTLGLWGGASPFPSLLVTCLIFLPLAVISLKAWVRLHRAEKLVDSQPKR